MEAAEVAAVVGKVAERLDAEDYDDHKGITEESVAEVLSWLELEIKLSAGAILVLPPPPAGGCAMVSGNTESCGSSLSGPASTVMASVDGRVGAPPPPTVPWPWPFAGAVAMAVGDEEEDDGDSDDDWVSQLLTDGPAGEGSTAATSSVSNESTSLDSSAQRLTGGPISSDAFGSNAAIGTSFIGVHK